MNVVYTRETSDDVDQVGKRLEIAVAQRDFGVLEVIDLKDKMNSKGVAFDQECRVYEVCSPHHAKRVLGVDMRISTVLPCRISIYQENGMTKVSAVLPSVLLNIFHATSLWSVAQQVENDVTGIIDAAIATQSLSGSAP